LAMTGSSSTHYALVQEGPILTLSGEKHKRDLRQELSSIYSSYAELYPNPSLTDEYLERDRLLQGVRSALVAQRSQPIETTKRKGGFFASFFAGARKTASMPEEPAIIDDDDYLVYSDMDISSHIADLCGTSNALQLNCVPEEAHSMARFHLCSHHRGSPIVVKGSPTPLLILSLGIVAEHDGQQWNHSQTSDKGELEQHISTIETNFYFSHTRAVAVGDNFMAISWGLGDGVLVLYRRAAGFANKADWQAFGCACPTPAVLENLQATGDVFLQNLDGSLSSQSLRVTDVCPLVVDLGEAGAAATLAVSRLGAYMELIPLDMPLWLGPILTPKTHKPAKRQKSKRGTPQHYATGHLYNICSEGGVAALTTSEHHSDILTLEAFRTSVKIDMEWDAILYPDSPPAEYVLAATGTANGEEMITFWAISTVFSEISVESFRLHVILLDALCVGKVGADVSLFATDEITQHWRRPRFVALRPFDQVERIISGTEEKPTKRNKLSTLSTLAPIVSMRFCFQDGRALLVVLDFNGGITLVDSTHVMAHASQRLNVEQIQKMEQQQMPMTSISMSRSEISKQTGGRVVDADWMATGNLVTTSSLGKLQIIIWDGNQLHGSIGIPTISQGSKILNIYNDEISILMKKSKGLALCSIQKLDPITIIQRLAQAGKFKEAIAASISVANHSEIADVVDMCHRTLWRTDHAVENLAEVADELFVTEQVLSLFENPAYNVNGIQFEVGVQACLVALNRLRNARQDIALQIGGEKGVDDLKSKVRNVFIKLGTFSLLCEAYGVKATLVNFRDRFMNVPIEELAKSIAGKGDVVSLTVLMYRHRHELRTLHLEIVSKLPLTLDPATYCHLLPVQRPDGDFFMLCDEQKGVRQWAFMNVYMKETMKKRLDHDDIDAGSLAEALPPPIGESNGPASPTELAGWYLDRALALEAAVGTLGKLETFCALALKCLFITNKPTHHDESSISRLYSMKISARCLDELGIADSTRMGGKGISTDTWRVSASELLEMPLDQLIATLLSSSQDPLEVFSRLKTMVFPILNLPSHSSVRAKYQNEQEAEASTEGAIVAYCLAQINSTKGDSSESFIASSSMMQIRFMRDTLTTCAMIANASRSSITRQDRLIKNRATMMTFVTEVFYSVSAATSDLSLLSSDCRHIIELLWEMYECLPNQVSVDEKLDETALSLHSKVDILYRHLIAIELMSRWAPNIAVPYASKLKHATGTDAMMQLGIEMVTRMCQTFCKNLKKENGHTTNNEDFISLLDLISDLKQISIACFDSSLDLGTVVNCELIITLLQRGQFHLISTLLSKNLSLVSNSEVERAVVTFVNGAMFDDDTTSTLASGASIQLAMRCQDILGPRFPALQISFHSMRKYLDAAHFANSVLLRETRGSEVRPTEVRDSPPLDIVEKVLRANPRAILEGCPDWKSSEFASNTNAAILRSFQACSNSNFNIDSQQPQIAEFPPLPGGGIFHLAMLVGLLSQSASIVVKARVAHHALAVGMPWISATLCLSIIYESDGALSSAEISLLLVLVEQVVTCDTYDDLATRKSLCQAVLIQLKSQISTSDCKVFESLCCAYTVLESRTSRFRPESLIQPQLDDNAADHSIDNGSSFLAFRAAAAVVNMVGHLDNDSQLLKLKGPEPRPIDRVYRETMAGYNTNIHELFSILQVKASSSEPDDHLLIAIGRLVTFWAITVSSRLTSENMNGTREHADTAEVLQLCAAVLFHVNDKEVLKSEVMELRQIAEGQAERALELSSLHSTPISIRPDLGIVRVLMGRGFTENGARRAAVMTNNASSELALQWAISHSLESGFDNPIILIKSTNESHVDRKLMGKVKEVLFLANQLANGETIISALLPQVECNSELLNVIPFPKSTKPDQFVHHPFQKPATECSNGDLSTRSMSTIRKTATSMTSVELLSDSIEPNPPAPKRLVVPSSKEAVPRAQKVVVPVPPPPPPPTPIPMQSIVSCTQSILALADAAEKSVHSSSEISHQPKKPIVALNKPTPDPASETENYVVIKPNRPPPPKVLVSPPLKPVTEKPPTSLNQLNPPTISVAVPTSTTHSMNHPQAATVHTRSGSSNETGASIQPLPPPTPRLMDRSILRKVGQKARVETNAVSAMLDPEERKRLVMKGRKLLEQARESGSSPNTKTADKKALASNSSSTSRYALRSRVSKTGETVRPPPPPPPPPKQVPVPPEEEPTIEEDSNEDDDGSGWDFEF